MNDKFIGLVFYLVGSSECVPVLAFVSGFLLASSRKRLWLWGSPCFGLGIFLIFFMLYDLGRVPKGDLPGAGFGLVLGLCEIAAGLISIALAYLGFWLRQKLLPRAAQSHGATSA